MGGFRTCEGTTATGPSSQTQSSSQGQQTDKYKVLACHVLGLLSGEEINSKKDIPPSDADLALLTRGPAGLGFGTHGIINMMFRNQETIPTNHVSQKPSTRQPEALHTAASKPPHSSKSPAHDDRPCRPEALHKPS